MPRRRKRDDEDTVDDAPGTSGQLDANAIVSYNIKRIRERQGWTQQSVAERLGRLTGHELPQASISAMERGFDGERKRRFDAHELYLLSVVFNVPIVYFFLPPPDTGFELLADTGRPITELYANLLGREDQLPPVDERLEEINISNPDETDAALAAIFGAENAARNWHPSFRTWRRKRLVEMEKEYGDQLDKVAAFLKEFALKIEAIGPRGYLEATSYREGDNLVRNRLDDEGDVEPLSAEEILREWNQASEEE
jgi:transcriptional regulator with XRE-family HTH domain